MGVRHGWKAKATVKAVYLYSLFLFMQLYNARNYKIYITHFNYGVFISQSIELMG